jgi:putative transposase
MGFSYVVKDQGAVHFVTFTVHQWVDLFTRSEYVDILIKSLKYCQAKKGLEIYAWIIMSNHCHLIIRAKNENLSDIIRDFKKFTSKAIYKAIEDNNSESRKEWLLKVLKYKDKIWLWKEGYHGEEILSKDFYNPKSNLSAHESGSGRDCRKGRRIFVEQRGRFLWNKKRVYCT